MGRPIPERHDVITRERSPVREFRTPGSARGAVSNRRPYRDFADLFRESMGAALSADTMPDRSTKAYAASFALATGRRNRYIPRQL